MNASIIPVFLPGALVLLIWFAFSYWQASSASQSRSFSYYSRYRVAVPRFNMLEFGVALLVAIVASVGFWYLFKDSQSRDNENLNGRIVEKLARVEVPCTHCEQVCTGKDDKGNCNSWRTDCDHSHDYDWRLVTDFAPYFAEGTITVARIDRQGLNEPPAWTSAWIGQPVTVLHSYTNLLRGGGKQSVFGFNPDSTLANTIRDAGLLPPRFQNVYSGWDYTPRMVIVTDSNQGTRPAPVEWDDLALLAGNTRDNFLTSRQYNRLLMDANGDVGPQKQANIQIIVCVSVCADSYSAAVMDGWVGGAKNDLNVFIGVDTAWKPIWADVKYGLPGEDQSEDVGKGNNAYLAQVLASRIMLEVTDVRNADQVVAMVKEETLANFNRKPNKDFAHLEPGIHPTTGQLVFSSLLVILVSVGVGVYFQAHDPFGLD